MRKHFMNKRYILSIFLLILFGCSNPLSEEEEKAVVKTLVSGTLPLGEYVVFWDGTDEKNQSVPPGTYYARLYSRNFTHQIEMTALEGGKGISNDSSYSNPGIQLITQLKQNHPNPFYIKDGTNIPFTLSEEVSVQLTIRNKK